MKKNVAGRMNDDSDGGCQRRGADADGARERRAKKGDAKDEATSTVSGKGKH